MQSVLLNIYCVIVVASVLITIDNRDYPHFCLYSAIQDVLNWRKFHESFSSNMYILYNADNHHRLLQYDTIYD
jgi:hypothetical protein